MTNAAVADAAGRPGPVHLPDRAQLVHHRLDLLLLLGRPARLRRTGKGLESRLDSLLRRLGSVARADGHGLGDLFLDKEGQLRRQEHGAAVEGEVGAVLVTAETVGGQLDDAGDGDGIEPDQGTDDACFPGNGAVVQAAPELLLEVLFVQEPGRVLLGRSGDGEFSGDVAGHRPLDERGDRPVQEEWSTSQRSRSLWVVSCRSISCVSSQDMKSTAALMSLMSPSTARAV
ncbi:hypothetical protein [Streptomyces sp. Ru72]|uniref:hypothetical protein n=1 Tax=Streptomyces sp. Ru72 TaxID=2080747 RepID=UPI0021561674|nr:hypothetical protein [Streptomyces sp. Ru72]